MDKRGGQNKLKQDIIIERFVEKHGDKFDYSKVDYKDINTPIEVYCKKHEYTFFPTPKNHLKSIGCKHCGRESQIQKASKGKEKFIEDVVEKYGDIYDFSLVEYVNTKTPVKLICKNGEIINITPNKLLSCKDYTPSPKKKTKSNDKDIFIKEATKVYGDKDDYTDTNIISSKIDIEVRCKKHDITFKKSISNYLSGCGCPKCSAENYNKIRTKSTENFIKQAKEVHGDNCDYTDTIYKSCREKVKIRCNKHNVVFNQLPSNHLNGGSCKKCLSENISNALFGKEGTGGYTKSGYANQANGREAKVYLIKCFNEDEEFYKIGKTFLDISKRFKKDNLCYSFEVVHFIFGEAGEIYDLENEFHRTYKSYKYRPINWFAGHTECYGMDLPIEEIINFKKI